jgi:hypothetical protein
MEHSLAIPLLHVVTNARDPDAGPKEPNINVFGCQRVCFSSTPANAKVSVFSAIFE